MDFNDCQSKSQVTAKYPAIGHGVVAVIFHSDPIKLAVAHFLGMPLDHFQRLGCDTGSLTAMYISETGASLMKLNQRPPFDFLPKERNK